MHKTVEPMFVLGRFPCGILFLKICYNFQQKLMTFSPVFRLPAEKINSPIRWTRSPIFFCDPPPNHSASGCTNSVQMYSLCIPQIVIIYLKVNLKKYEMNIINLNWKLHYWGRICNALCNCLYLHIHIHLVSGKQYISTILCNCHLYAWKLQRKYLFGPVKLNCKLVFKQKWDNCGSQMYNHSVRFVGDSELINTQYRSYNKAFHPPLLT